MFIGKRISPAMLPGAAPGDSDGGLYDVDCEGCDRPPGDWPGRDRRKALIFSCISCGKPPPAAIILDNGGTAAGRRAMFRPPSGLNEEDMDDTRGGSEAERVEEIRGVLDVWFAPSTVFSGADGVGEVSVASVAVGRLGGEAILCVVTYAARMRGKVV